MGETTRPVQKGEINLNKKRSRNLEIHHGMNAVAVILYAFPIHAKSRDERAFAMVGSAVLIAARSKALL
jgi:hypothetical protein